MILHKSDCNGSLAHRSQYLVPLNRAYNEKFENFNQYKHDNNFKLVTSGINIAMVDILSGH